MTTRTDQLREAIAACESRIAEVNGEIQGLAQNLTDLTDRRFNLIKESGNSPAQKINARSFKEHKKTSPIPEEVVEIEGKIRILNAQIDEKSALLASLTNEKDGYIEETRSLTSYSGLGRRRNDSKMGVTMIQSATISRYLNYLPTSEATYILSQSGLIKYVGCTNNLQRRMSHHKSQNKKIHFDSGSLLHWFDLRDPDLERELQRRLRPTLGTISIYQSLDSIPYIFRDFYLRKINYLIDSIPDDCQEAFLLFNQIFGYYRILQKHYSRSYLEECLQWRIKCDAMRSLAKKQRLRKKAIA